ncbi:hypothetical protein KPSA1_02837 [Pseudomonas syringae pv. actinidiae]|uniref:Uncharacterized protein n=1 Tax=Pseudomonas syringae pv. actinidiae TaxID=103796 RepID=A0A2V0Q9H0_PSESF|nr:hypothetical protein KPSA1_02837 [Pseudomonas syringae pv. actinidiae]
MTPSDLIDWSSAMPTGYYLVYRLKINFSHACVLIATRARWILFKISSPLAFQT